MRFTFLLCLTLSLALVASAQESSDQPVFSHNSISVLLAEHPPELLDGYPEADDLWMLYDWRFDVLSNGAQRFLLQKYGLLPAIGGQEDADAARLVRKPSGAVHPQATPGAPLAPGANVRVDQALFEVGPRLESETTIAVNGQNIAVGFNSLLGQAVTFSKDGGATWSAGRLPSFPGQLQNSGDPVLAVGPNGRLYHAYLAPNAIGLLAIGVAYS